MRPRHWIAIGATLPLAAAVLAGGLTFYGLLAADIILRRNP